MMVPTRKALEVLKKNNENLLFSSRNKEALTYQTFLVELLGNFVALTDFLTVFFVVFPRLAGEVL